MWLDQFLPQPRAPVRRPRQQLWPTAWWRARSWQWTQMRHSGITLLRPTAPVQRPRQTPWVATALWPPCLPIPLQRPDARGQQPHWSPVPTSGDWWRRCIYLSKGEIWVKPRGRQAHLASCWSWRRENNVFGEFHKSVSWLKGIHSSWAQRFAHHRAPRTTSTRTRRPRQVFPA